MMIKDERQREIRRLTDLYLYNTIYELCSRLKRKSGITVPVTLAGETGTPNGGPYNDMVF